MMRRLQIEGEMQAEGARVYADRSYIHMLIMYIRYSDPGASGRRRI